MKEQNKKLAIAALHTLLRDIYEDSETDFYVWVKRLDAVSQTIEIIGNLK